VASSSNGSPHGRTLWPTPRGTRTLPRESSEGTVFAAGQGLVEHNVLNVPRAEADLQEL
jgi:hypothetical protein